MNSNHLAIRLTALSVLAGAFGMACSSSSNKGSPGPTDAATTETDGEVSDASSDAATTCVPTDAGLLSAYVPPVVDASFSPSAIWDCNKAACTAAVSGCSSDCECNNAFMGELEACKATNASEIIGCFSGTETGGDTATQTLTACLLSNTACITNPYGTDAAASDAATTTTDAGTTTTDASDGAVEQ